MSCSRHIGPAAAFAAITCAASVGGRLRAGGCEWPSFPGPMLAVGHNPVSLAIGDFDGDQVPDLAVANYSSDDISIVLGNGDGGFGAAASFPVGTAPTASRPRTSTTTESSTSP